MKKIKLILSILFLIILIRYTVPAASSLLFKTILVNFWLAFVILISHMIIIYGNIKLIFAIKEENKKKESVAIKIILCGFGILFLEAIVYTFIIIGKTAPPV